MFHDIDYVMLWFKLMCKDYEHIAKCLVPTGDHIAMGQKEIAGMLRKKTRRFTEVEITEKFGKQKVK